MNTPSLRSRLLKSLVLPIAGGILFVGAASCISTYHEAAEIYDAEQVHFAKVLHTLASQLTKGEVISIEGIPRRGAYEKYVTFRIWKNGQLFLKSDNAMNLGPVTPGEGFTNRMIGETRWRFYVEHQGDVTVEVAEENEVRLDMVRHIIGGIFLPQLIIIPIIAMIIWLGITRGLLPVERLSQLVRKRNVNQLDPIPSQQVPNDLLPMVDAINDLMERVVDAMRVEKNFTNYAAHEMRTPIAALKTQAQVILRTKDIEKQKELVYSLLETVSRTQRIIEQLLTYARVQNDAVAITELDLKALVLDEVRHAVPRAVEKGMTMEEKTVPAVIHGQVDLLRLIIINLLDNAIKYGREHGHIEIEIEVGEAGTALTVRDDGPGIPAEHLPHIFDPFYRITGMAATGAGLGLAIVKWACDVQHIAITPTVGLNGKGAGFTLLFLRS